MGKILHFDPFSGIAGDMALAALVDVGADPLLIEQLLQSLPLETLHLQWTRTVKKGISARAVRIITEPENTGHSHRRYREIVDMLKSADLPERAVLWSLQIFERIGQAEARIHGIALDEVHFHEVGAIDSIVDIVGTALALDQLNPDRISSSPPPLGNGEAAMAHGVYPLPAPATLELMKGYPIRSTPMPFELTTPTGAGILTALTEHWGPVPDMTVERIGYGAGMRDLPDRPNVLRVVLGNC
jgi:uncharacterized protein (TIGR00299 family) protein